MLLTNCWRLSVSKSDRMKIKTRVRHGRDMGITTMINMQRALMEKVNNMQEQMDNIRIEMDILRKKKMMLEIKKNNVSKMRKASDGLICKLDKAEERISEREDITTEISETKKQREKKTLKKTSQYPRTVRQLQKV